jgi:hypothetical protein
VNGDARSGLEPGRLLVGLPGRARRVRELLVERLAVTEAAPHELRPGRHGDPRLQRLRQEPPEGGVVPAEVVSAAVAVSAYAGAKALDLVDQLFTGEHVQVVVHVQILAKGPSLDEG